MAPVQAMGQGRALAQVPARAQVPAPEVVLSISEVRSLPSPAPDWSCKTTVATTWESPRTALLNFIPIKRHKTSLPRLNHQYRPAALPTSPPPPPLRLA